MDIVILNLVRSLFPSLLIITLIGGNSLKLLIISASGLFASICLKTYDYINELQLDFLYRGISAYHQIVLL